MPIHMNVCAVQLAGCCFVWRNGKVHIAKEKVIKICCCAYGNECILCQENLFLAHLHHKVPLWHSRRIKQCNLCPWSVLWNDITEWKRTTDCDITFHIDWLGVWVLISQLFKFWIWVLDIRFVRIRIYCLLALIFSISMLHILYNCKMHF